MRFAAWPCTRLVHVRSVPVGHLVRPCKALMDRPARPNVPPVPSGGLCR
ncbi:respiratory nitrate reductase subunit gamma [Streptomyces sp. NPDC059467]